MVGMRASVAPSALDTQLWGVQRRGWHIGVSPSGGAQLWGQHLAGTLLPTPCGDRVQRCPWGRGAGDAAGALAALTHVLGAKPPCSSRGRLRGATRRGDAIGGSAAQAALPQCPANLTPWHPRAVTVRDGVMQGDRRGQGSRQRLACAAGCVIRLRDTAHINPSLQVGASVGQSGSSGTGAVCAARAQPESPCWVYGLWGAGAQHRTISLCWPLALHLPAPSVAQGSALGLFSTSLGSSGK